MMRETFLLPALRVAKERRKEETAAFRKMAQEMREITKVDTKSRLINTNLFRIHYILDSIFKDKFLLKLYLHCKTSHQIHLLYSV